MSWSIEERIGEFRPFPAQVVVYKGNTDERLAYVSGEVADRLKAENAKLREQGERLFDKTLELATENDKLRDLCKWLLTPYRLGAVTGEGVDKKWCRETYDGGLYRLRELGVEV